MGVKHRQQTLLLNLFLKNIPFLPVGYLNRFKHPKPLILSRYLEHRSTLYRTDYDGAILIDFIENQLIQVQAWRKANAKYWHDKYL